MCFILQGAPVSFTLQGSHHSHALRTPVSKRQSSHKVPEEGRGTQGDGSSVQIKEQKQQNVLGLRSPHQSPFGWALEEGDRAGDVLTLLLSAPSSSLNKLGFPLRSTHDSGWHLADGMCNGTVTPTQV